MSKKVIIIGGVAGGASAAARLRRVDETSQIIMFERGEYISFANCGLPYYIGGVIKKRDALLLQTPQSFKARFNVDVRVQQEVMRINREIQTVTIKNLVTEEVYEESYDQVILAPGSSPLKPPIPGIELEGIMSLWNIPDTDRIKAYVDEKKPERAVVVGGGFIGVEMVENLHARGIHVTLVELMDQVMAPLDFEMAQIVHQHMSVKGVTLKLKKGVKSFRREGELVYVDLQDGETIETDLVILSIGIRPNGELAKNSGLDINERGGIRVDKHLLTSDPNIYAVGDAIEVVDYVSGLQTMIPLAGPANKQGRIVANHMSGIEDSYKGTQGSSVAKIFDVTVATTGHNEKQLNRNGKVYKKDYEYILIQPRDHASYYPGSNVIYLKLIFEIPSGKVLGAQAVGVSGVDKRIDVIATSMRFGATIYDLRDLELTYAPSFSSAKDPVNMAAFAAENILTGQMDVFNYKELNTIDFEKSVLLDVRMDGERSRGYIEGSIHIPVDDLRQRANELPLDRTIYVYCAVGIRGYIASKILKARGYQVKNMIGGYGFYEAINQDYND